MVLSNKKLKQKLREELAESLLASVAGKDSDAGASVSLDSESGPHSLKQLLRSESRPRLSKRQKRRSSLSLSGSDAKENDEGKGSESQGPGQTKKEKKRKREEGEAERNAVDELGENNEKVKKLKKNKKKKKKKKKKKTKHVENGEDKEQEAEVGNEIEGFEENDGNLGSEVVATKVYVGGIPYYSTEDDICSFFESCGTITEVDCMKFPESRKFRGIAILSFKTEAAAQRALAMDGADMGGLFLKVQPYKATRTPKPVDFSPGIVEGYNRIYLGNLSWDVTEDDVKKLFSSCKIASLRFGMDKETGEFRGYAHVDFSDSVSMKAALKLDQELVHDRPVKIRCAVPMKGTERRVEKGAETRSEPEPVVKEADVGLSSVSGKIRRRTCYECGEKGHLSSNCPKKQLADSAAS